MRISDWSSDVCSSDLFEYHVQRDQEQHEPACYTEARQADAQRAEQILANERKDQEDDGGHGNGTNGHGTPLRRGSVTGEAGVDRRTSRRVDQDRKSTRLNSSH